MAYANLVIAVFIQANIISVNLPPLFGNRLSDSGSYLATCTVAVSWEHDHVMSSEPTTIRVTSKPATD